MPSLGVILSEFLDEPYLAESYRKMELSVGEDRVIFLATIPSCDRRTDGRTTYGYRTLHRPSIC